MAVSLSIIIVSYNVRHFLEQCLLSVRQASTQLDVEVIVVDNQSTDGTLQHLNPIFPGVHFIDAGQNLGFAKACNLGYQYATGAYILFLNPDTLLAPDSLDQTLAFIRNQPNCGAVGVQMVDGSGRFLKESKRGFPGPLPSLYKLTGMARLFPYSRVWARYYLGHLSPHQSHPVDVLAGAFMLVPRRVLEEVGLFDEAFFMYGEDIDLCYRIQKAGYQNYYFAGTTIIHFKGESTRLHSAQQVQMFYHAMDIFVRKHFSKKGARLFTVLLRMGIRIRAAMQLLAMPLRLLINNLPIQQKPSPVVAIYAGDEAFEQISGTYHSQGCTVCRLSELEEEKLLTRGQQLVLSTTTEGLSAYIRHIGQQPARLRYRFHLCNSHSVVGSDAAGCKGSVVELAPAANHSLQPFNLVN